MTDRRNTALEKDAKRVCDSQTTAAIEVEIGEGGGDDDEEDESEDEDITNMSNGGTQVTKPIFISVILKLSHRVNFN